MAKTRSKSVAAPSRKGKSPAKRNTLPRRGSKGAGKMLAALKNTSAKASTSSSSATLANTASTSACVLDDREDIEIPGACNISDNESINNNTLQVHQDEQFSDDELPFVEENPVASDVGSHIDEDTVGKIVQGRYVQFSSLLPSNRDTQKIVFSAGTGSLAAVSSNRRLFNFSEWLDAFIIYSAIRGAAHPNEAVPLVKYLQTIKRIQGRNGNFVRYDDAFRAKYKGASTIPWHRLDSEELSWSMGDPDYIPYKEYQRRSNDSTVSFKTLRNGRNGAGISKPGSSGMRPKGDARPAFTTSRRCHSFNEGASCQKTPCPFLHVCKACGGNHALSHCYQKTLRRN